MPINSKYVFVASMNVDLDKEDLFNEVYDTEHVPNLDHRRGQGGHRARGRALQRRV